MPCEKRLITFSEGEVREALLMLLAGNQSEGRGEIADISLGEGTTAIVKYTRRRDMEVNQKALCETLLAYCKARNIPIPQRGLKSLRREDTAITLVIELANAPFATQLRLHCGP